MSLKVRRGLSVISVASLLAHLQLDREIEPMNCDLNLSLTEDLSQFSRLRNPGLRSAPPGA